MNSTEAKIAALENLVQEIGTMLHDSAMRAAPALLDQRTLRGRMLGELMHDERLRSALFQFIDVLPQLHDAGDIAAHFRAYLEGHELSGPWRGLLSVGKHALGAPMLKLGIARIARVFLVEENEASLKRAVTRVKRLSADITLDAVGEAVLTEGEADAYVSRNLHLLDWLVRAGIEQPHLSLKLSALTPRFEPIDPAGTWARIRPRLDPLMQKLIAFNGAVTVDMEQHDFKLLILTLFRDLVNAWPQPGWQPGIAMQSYLTGADEDLHELIGWARETKRRIGIRLVRGAYWDTEGALARQRNWPVPVYENKVETDAAYERLSVLLLENTDWVYPAFATHNLRSLAHAMAVARSRKLDRTQWEIQMLWGMAEPLAQAVAQSGARLRLYLPSGELLTGIAYLIRRLLENTASTSILRQTYVEGMALDQLLAPPATTVVNANKREQESSTFCSLPSCRGGLGRGNGVADSGLDLPPPNRPVAGGYTRPVPTGQSQAVGFALSASTPRQAGEACQDSPFLFTNTPLLDFSLPQVRADFVRAIAEVRQQLGGDAGLQIAGMPEAGVEQIEIRNPADTRELLGRVELGGMEHAEQSLLNASRALPAWRDLGFAARAALCREAAERLLKQRQQLAALEVLEAGKSWIEADADVAEAIDYLRYYADEAEKLHGWHSTAQFPAERNHLAYEPCGVALAIAPWNFPLAILAGMSTAALVTGNPVIMKPAGPTPLIAGRFRDILLEAGFPPEVCQLLPALGEAIGRHLVEHTGVQLIAFTGSRAVGLDILARAHQMQAGQLHVKRVICEMGGKNAIIVDSDADLDLAVPEILASAFGYQGQKCSACSRVIAVGGIHDKLAARLADALACLDMGPPENPAHSIGPLINAQALDKANRYLAIGREEGRLYFQGEAREGGHYFAPAILMGIQAQHRLAREEIFAPILAILRAPDFDAAMAMAQDSDYALTGGIFSRLPGHLQLAREKFRVGNLYLNRRITGARVGVQPFGGVRLSGAGLQAGGPDYLRQFVTSRVVSENTLRHGYVPEH